MQGRRTTWGSRWRQKKNHYFFTGAGGALTLLDSQARPSRRPSPVVAQLGTTYHTLSLSLESWRASVTSWGFRAVEKKRQEAIGLAGYEEKGAIEKSRERGSRVSLPYAPSGRSCLLAKTRSKLSFISRSLMILCNSCFASSIRARSEESMTKMRPWVPVMFT